jgi:hypothetical protein
VASSVFNSVAFRTIMLMAVLLVLAGMSFMAVVKADFQAAAVSVAGLLVLMVIVDAFKGLGKGG